MPRSLASCPSKPNCVCSNATDTRHRIDAFDLATTPESAWPLIREVLEAWPRTRILEADDRYLHAACRTRVLGFVDDLELLLDRDGSGIAVRSASRVGYSDLGANRRRVERLRDALRRRQVVR